MPNFNVVPYIPPEGLMFSNMVEMGYSPVELSALSALAQSDTKKKESSWNLCHSDKTSLDTHDDVPFILENIEPPTSSPIIEETDQDLLARIEREMAMSTFEEIELPTSAPRRKPYFRWRDGGSY